MPISSRSQKLSKIETLRLARNYIGILGTILQKDESMESNQMAKSLSQGMSQGTSNLIAGFLHLNPRTLIPHEGSMPHKPIHYAVFEPSGILRDYQGSFTSDSSISYDIPSRPFSSSMSEDETLSVLSNSSNNSALGDFTGKMQNFNTNSTIQSNSNPTQDINGFPVIRNYYSQSAFNSTIYQNEHPQEQTEVVYPYPTPQSVEPGFLNQRPLTIPTNQTNIYANAWSTNSSHQWFQ